MIRLREFLSDRWFDLLLWCRYDLSWRTASAGVLAAILSMLVVVLVLPPGSAPDAAVVSSPVTLPVVEPATLEFSPLGSPVFDVLVVGDSLVAGEEEIYREAFDAVGVSARFDAAVSRGLRYGWLCPGGSSSSGSAGGEGSGDLFTDAHDGDLEGGIEGEFDGELAGEELDEVPVDAVGEGSFPGDRGEFRDDGAGVSDSASAASAPSAGCSRQGLEAISWYASSQGFSDALVVALGTNDASWPARQVLERLGELRSLLGGRPVFLLQTVTYPMTSFHAAWNDTARTWCLADVSCRFVEWVSAPAPAEFFGADGVHLSVLGSRSRAHALAAVLVSGS